MNKSTTPDIVVVGSVAFDSVKTSKAAHEKLPVSYTHLDVYKRQALTPPDFGPGDWWRCSEGIKTMISETAAYLYEVTTGVF